MALNAPTTPEFAVGNDAAILIGHRDETRLNNKVELHDGRELIKRTTFQAPGYSEELSYGLLSGTVKASGYLSQNRDIVSAQMATFLGKNRKSKHVLIGPSGLKPGYEAVFCDTKAEAFDVDVTYGGITTAATGFATTESGLIDGFCLHSPHGAASFGGNEAANLVFTNVNPAQFLGLRGFGVTATGAANLFSFRLSDYATDAALTTAIKANLEALTVYSGRTVTVTVATARTTTAGLVSLVLRIEWSGAVNVTNLETLQGALHVLTLLGATAAKTVYGTVNVDPAASTAATVQTAVQAKGGDYGAGIVSKSGTGGNAVYTFAYPVGAAPAGLVQPVVSANEVQTLATNGTYAGGAIPITGPGGTVNITPGDSLGSIGTVLSTAFGAAGSVTATGTTLATGGSVVSPLTILPATVQVTNPGNAIDGNAATAATFNGNNTASTLYLDLGSIKKVLSVRIKGTGTFAIYGGNQLDGSDASTAIRSQDGYFGPSDNNWFTFPTNNSTSVRFICFAPSAAGNTLSEIEVTVQIGSLALTYTIGGTLSGTNVAQLTGPSTVTIATTTQGGNIADPQASVSLLSAGASTVVSPLVLQEGGVSGLTYNLLTASGQDVWVDFGSGTARTEALLSLLSLTGAGATLTVKVDHADDSGGVPGAVSEAFSFDVQTNTTATYAVQLFRAITTPLKRWRRCRFILTGTNPVAVFAVAVAA